MNLKFKNDVKEITIQDIPESLLSSNEGREYILAIIETLYDNPERKSNVNLSDVDNNKVINFSKDIKTQVKDRPVIRDRLPNTVDLSELEIKKAVTEEPMIRCPNCGQSSTVIVIVSDTVAYLMRKETVDNKETFKIVTELEPTEENIENASLKYSVAPMVYYKDIQSIKRKKKYDGLDIAVDNNTDIYCPMCREKHKFSNWLEAYRSPLELGFETELLCDVCGGEAVQTIDSKRNKILRCESCGFTKIVL